MNWFYTVVVLAAGAAVLGFGRLAELLLAAAAVIGYMDTRLPRDISVTLIRKESAEVQRHD